LAARSRKLFYLMEKAGRVPRAERACSSSSAGRACVSQNSLAVPTKMQTQARNAQHRGRGSGVKCCFSYSNEEENTYKGTPVHTVLLFLLLTYMPHSRCLGEAGLVDWKPADQLSAKMQRTRGTLLLERHERDTQPQTRNAKRPSSLFWLGFGVLPARRQAV